MKSYSLDLRERVLAACDAKEGTKRAIAKRLRVSEDWIYKILRQRRVCDAVPHGHWCTTTMVSVIGLSGPKAPFVFRGAMDAEAFRIYVERLLVAELQPGDIVVMDNLSSHKDVQARAMIERTGAVIRDLPPYSPDFNPIEPMWSKVKAFLRKAKARTEKTLGQLSRAGDYAHSFSVWLRSTTTYAG